MYEQSKETTPSRHAERARHEAELIHAVLDEALIGHLAFIDDDLPHVLPLLFVRVGDCLYLHGSTGAHFGRMASRRGSLRVTFEATLVDALVLARSAFNHSANYRCVVAHGDLTVVRDDEQKRAVLAALMDKLVPGRNADARQPEPDELRQTVVLRLPLTSVAAKVRTGGPLDGETEGDRPIWAGIRPILSCWGVAEPAEDLLDGLEVPSYLRAGESLPQSGAALTV
ncbi:MAG TPA: pyridoxamine 5'-phosphate oxidase family protein [Acidimicrobiales bacterium]|jgi:nitroimidazol reductase NimA-like FMN-containing flavoprotein (pyridoxamine 5'-phosphate oxidase superfamily)|nr:pyridoxamine 5'-phosphate oxidase family protein [Acidimicrobiales bacterium]